jgi:hypothetical protein
VANVASAFCAIAQLPDFQETPYSRRVLQELLLGGRSRVALAKDDRTYQASFRVRAEGGTVSVTYLPRNADIAAEIPRVLETVEGVEHILCTMASTRILWVQERFDPRADTFKHLLEVAEKWDAAVELLRLVASDAAPVIERAPVDAHAARPTDRGAIGGIEDDAENAAIATDSEESGMAETFAELVKIGRAGGQVTVHGTAGDIVAAVDRTTSYSLVVVGETFLSKGKAARLRLCRELGGALHDQLKVPVIQAEEMKEQYLFGPRQLVSLLIFLGLTVLAYALTFSHQREVIALMTKQGIGWRVLAAAVVAVVAPLVALVYGNAVRSLLKLIKME